MDRRKLFVLLTATLMLLGRCSSPAPSPSDVLDAHDTLAGEVVLADLLFADDPCEAVCEGKQCGDDGCGGSCGTCEGLHQTCLDGQCLCQSECGGKECGDDGCLGSCGDCPAGQVCSDGLCLCAPDCTGADCGDDGCGGSCGECLEGWVCTEGICEDLICVPDCAGLDCGGDGCEGSCGDCPAGHECFDGLCQCVPNCDGECGDDGCGGSCGKCEGPLEVCLDGACVVTSALGLPCDQTDDCPAEDICLLGMCTHACLEDGEPDEASCQDAAIDSQWAELFGCAADLGLCLPGAVTGIDVFCLHDSDCQAAGLEGFLCAGTLPFFEAAVGGICLPDIGLAKPGALCDQDGDCSTFACLTDPLVQGQAGRCSGYCQDSGECPSGSLCTAWPLKDGEDVIDYLPLCVPFAGSLVPCVSNGDCEIGKDYCGAVLSPIGGAPDFRCLKSANPQGLWAGSLCQEAGDCFEPYCMFEIWSANVDAYCTKPCEDASECPASMDCREITVEPFAGIWPGADFLLKMCVNVAHGAPCFVDMDGTCAFEWSQCVPIPGVGWIGTCNSGSCPPSCAGKACLEDNGCGQPCLNTCLTDGAPCGEGPQCLSGHCVQGVCCDSPCLGDCQSCLQPDTLGTCIPIPVGLDPDEDCGACHRCDGQGGCIALPAGPDDSGLCGPCQVCGADGECAPGPALADPLDDCGLCQLCDGEGGCVPVLYGADPKENCDVALEATCSSNGFCDGNGECANWPSMTPCGEAGCKGDKFNPAPLCDGDGKCMVQPFVDCAPYGCNTDDPACYEQCQAQTQCADGSWCNQGLCEAAPADCPVGQKLICGALVPADTTNSENLWSTYESCMSGIPYLAGERVYQVKSTKPQRISVTVTNLDFDAALVLLEGACLPDAACSQLVDYMPGGMAETLTFDVLPDTQYYVAVDGITEEDAGPMSIQADCCDIDCAADGPCGDDGCGGSCGTCDDESLCVAGECQACAGEESEEPNDFCETALPIEEGEWEFLLCPTGDQDWYSFEAGAGDEVTLFLDFDAEAADFDLTLYGEGCVEPIAESASPDETEFLTAPIPKAGTYFIRVFSFGGSQGSYALSLLVEEPECSEDEDCPPGQICALSECTVPPAPCPASGKLLCGQQVEGDTVGGESGLEEYTSCSEDLLTGPETIYTMVVQEATTATLTLSGLPEGGAVAVLQDYCATEWACRTLDTGTPGGVAQVVTKLLPGVIYYVLAEGLSEADAGPFVLNADCCFPQCDGLACGDDGCGTDCGPCPGKQEACIAGECVCQPNCFGKECGDDGCGGSCGECVGPQQICEETQCVCQPECGDKECGDDGCGGSCGICEDELTGCVEGFCQCLPQCAGKECGDDGCGGICGECSEQYLCSEGLCVCQPNCNGKVCGGDGCGGSCGECGGVQESCQAGFCVCQPSCAPMACGNDGCGGSCGECPAGRMCANEACACISDSGEPNPSCAQAKGIPPGVYDGLAICPAGEEDWFAFQLSAGQKLTLNIIFEHDDGDLDLFVYNQAACSSYLKASTSSTDDESIVFVAPATGTYTARVMEFGKLAENAYSLVATIQ